LNVDISKLLQGKLVSGFSGKLPELDLILIDIEDQKTSPPPGGFTDPTNIDTLDQVAGRAGKPDGKQLKLGVSTTGPERHFLMETAENLTLTVADPDDSLPQLRLPAEAFIRLVYGRLDAAHTPAVETKQVDLDELRTIFPGF